MLGGADNPNGELPSYITGANTGFGVQFMPHLIRPCIIPPVQRKSASFLCLQSACRIGPWVLTCCVDLCSGLPFSQSDKPDSIMDRFSR